MEITDCIKKFFLIGVGAAAETAEKSGEILDKLVEKGELTVSQGKELNKELKHAMKESGEKAKQKKSADDIASSIKDMSAEDLEKLKAAIAEAEKKDE